MSNETRPRWRDCLYCGERFYTGEEKCLAIALEEIDELRARLDIARELRDQAHRRRAELELERDEARAKVDRLKKARQTALDADAEETERWREVVDAEAEAEEKTMTDRYEKRGDVVLDTQTGLEWQAEAAERMTWDEANEYAEGLGNSWRLPSRFELESLLNLERANPASDFPGMPAQAFWSSSVRADSASLAWYVYFDYGYVNYAGKHNGSRVRCVRRRPQDGRFGSLAEAEAHIAELEAKLEAVRRWESELILPMIPDGLGGFSTDPRQIKLRAILDGEEAKDG